ncbi:putative E3 ubiquitin-protein ligase HECTD1 [Paratrimastix pyriformis]|uniref:E3 ubiquitin-protein ligase HECTD1 n=1 Tax=Paratrimastix pyriformis TaxID=342808 RepID=A0ABQ8UFU3_9EUKA|nr:putative E3 ubiquitin-protein ligase HECTD1 [Paratrimastix pyriformis]
MYPSPNARTGADDAWVDVTFAGHAQLAILDIHIWPGWDCRLVDLSLSLLNWDCHAIATQTLIHERISVESLFTEWSAMEKCPELATERIYPGYQCTGHVATKRRDGFVCAGAPLFVLRASCRTSGDTMTPNQSGPAIKQDCSADATILLQQQSVSQSVSLLVLVQPLCVKKCATSLDVPLSGDHHPDPVVIHPWALPLVLLVRGQEAPCLSPECDDATDQANQAMRTIRNLQTKRASLQAQLAQAEHDRDLAQANTTLAQMAVELAQRDLAQAQRDFALKLAQAKEEVHTLTDQLVQWDLDLAESQRDRAQAMGQLACANDELTGTKGELAQRTDQLIQTREELALTKGELTLTKGELALTKGELALTKGELAQRTDQLIQTKEELALTKGELTLTKERTQRAVGEMEHAVLDTPEGLAVVSWNEATKEAILEWRPINTTAAVSYQMFATFSPGFGVQLPASSSFGDPAVVYTGPECRCRVRFPSDRAEARFAVVAIRGRATSGPSAPVTYTHPVVFRYVYDMDEHGLFYYIGTRGGTQPWQNPAEEGWVTTARSFPAGGNATDITGRRPCRSWTDNLSGAWWQVDLGAGRLFTPTHYTLRQSNHPPDDVENHRLLSWRFEGSVDGQSWRTLDEHTKEPHAIPARVDAMATFTVAPERAFPARYFRVLMTGPSPNGFFNLILAGLEMYGTLSPDPAPQ